MKNNNSNKNGKILYAVNYVDRETLEMRHYIKTHSKEKAFPAAKYLKTKSDILYSQVVIYYYNDEQEFYEFKTLKNYYKY